MRSHWPFVAFYALLVVALLGRLRSGEVGSETASAPAADMDWPKLPANWVSVELEEGDRRYARNFPGAIAAFEGDGQRWLLRRMDRATRRLHSSAVCLRGMGFEVIDGPLRRDHQGVVWRTMLARKPGVELALRERIFASDGQSWTDVSAWFWSAALSRSTGPWYAITQVGRNL